MTIRVAWWLLEKEKEVAEYVIGRPMGEWDPAGKPEHYVPFIGIPLIIQTSAVTLGGHMTIMTWTDKMESYTKSKWKWIQPPPGSPWYRGATRVAKNKWLMRGARLGARTLPWVNAAIFAYDVYTIGGKFIRAAKKQDKKMYPKDLSGNPKD